MDSGTPGGMPASDRLAGRISGRSGQPPESSGTGPVSPDVVRTVVLPVRPSASAIKAGTIKAGVAGHESGAALWYAYPEPAAAAHKPAGEASARALDWVPGTPAWRTSKSAPKSAESGASPAGMWVACVEVPAGSESEGVMIEGRHVALPETPAGPVPRGRHAASSAFARAALDGSRRSPLTRWRARLAAGDPLLPDAAAPTPDAFSDATLEGLARHYEQEWSVVLARLNAADPHLAERFASRLAGVVDIGDGVSIPIWSDSVQTESMLDSLLGELLRAGADTGRASQIALSWLHSQPVGGAIVIDDAAAIDIRAGLTFPSMLLANLTDLPAMATATRAEVVEQDLLRLEPLTAIFASVGAEAKPDENLPVRRRTGLSDTRAGRANDSSAEVRVGDWRAKRAVVGQILRIGPPGLEVGPLFSDWSQQTLFAAATDPSPSKLPRSEADRGFDGWLRPAAESGAAPGLGRWTVYFEIERPDVGGGEDRSELTLFFGPRGGPGSESLRVLADGSLIEVRAGQAIPAGRATVTKGSDRTQLWVPIPQQAIEGGKVLRLGLVRTDGQGRRAAWPRPMLPWQTEPGRIAVDLSTWGPAKE